MWHSKDDSLLLHPQRRPEAKESGPRSVQDLRTGADGASGTNDLRVRGQYKGRTREWEPVGKVWGRVG